MLEAILAQLLSPTLAHLVFAVLGAGLGWWAKKSVPEELKPAVNVLKARHAARQSAAQDSAACRDLHDLAQPK